MATIKKEKVEVLLVQSVKSSFETICQDKGISIAEGLRRAVEEWMKHERTDHQSH